MAGRSTTLGMLPETPGAGSDLSSVGRAPSHRVRCLDLDPQPRPPTVRTLRPLVVFSLTVAATSAAAAQPSSRHVWPTKGWSTATPQAVGLNGKVLDSLDAEIKSGRYGNVDRM